MYRTSTCTALVLVPYSYLQSRMRVKRQTTRPTRQDTQCTIHYTFAIHTENSAKTRLAMSLWSRIHDICSLDANIYSLHSTKTSKPATSATSIKSHTTGRIGFHCRRWRASERRYVCLRHSRRSLLEMVSSQVCTNPSEPSTSACVWLYCTSVRVTLQLQYNL